MGHAPDSLVALVPVLDRPANVAPLVESFLRGCPEDSQLVFLTGGPTGDIDECRAVRDFGLVPYPDRVQSIGGILPIPGTDGIGRSAITWPEKINIGVACFDPDWYLLAADDVEFSPGWWDATESLRADPKIGVIGTNDLANPRVMAGEHATHWLMRRTYIEECGTIDEPGKAVHAGFRHWYVDDECIATAKYRGAWAFCAEAVIQHHHPYFDERVPWDDTYALGESESEADQALFVSRAHLFGVTVG